MSHRIARACLCAALLAPRLAAAIDCEDISGGEPIIYGAGGSAQRDLVGKAAGVLQTSDDPVYVVYKDDAGACSGINALAGLAAPTITGSAVYWDPAGVRTTCTLPLAGANVDFASMGNSPELCPLVTDPSLVEGINVVTGPISTVNLVVPNGSTQTNISAEATYLVFGLGPDADVAPWNDPDPANYVFRNENSFVQLAISAATGVPATKFFGTDAGTNTNSVAFLAALADPEKGIGFVSGDVADANRATVKTLAYQHFGQIAGYWPDSTASAFDKKNVRNGQYFLWSPGHFYGLEGATPGSYADKGVQTLVEYMAGISQPKGTTQTITETAILNKNVPVCAMNVARDGDLGPVYSVAPAEPCGCFFDFSATGASTCDTCDDSTPCGAGVCRFGFCEAN